MIDGGRHCYFRALIGPILFFLVLAGFICRVSGDAQASIAGIVLLSVAGAVLLLWVIIEVVWRVKRYRKHRRRAPLCHTCHKNHTEQLTNPLCGYPEYEEHCKECTAKVGLSRLFAGQDSQFAQAFRGRVMNEVVGEINEVDSRISEIYPYPRTNSAPFIAADVNIIKYPT